jgi:hypothetical protein
MHSCNGAQRFKAHVMHANNYSNYTFYYVLIRTQLKHYYRYHRTYVQRSEGRGQELQQETRRQAVELERVCARGFGQ